MSERRRTTARHRSPTILTPDAVDARRLFRVAREIQLALNEASVWIYPSEHAERVKNARNALCKALYDIRAKAEGLGGAKPRRQRGR